jgi:hypothetical protein
MGSSDDKYLISKKDVIYFLTLIFIIWILFEIRDDIRKNTSEVEKLTFWSYIKLNQIWSELDGDSTKVD